MPVGIRQRRPLRLRSDQTQKIQADGEGFDAVSVTACADKGLPQSPIQGEAESEAVCPKCASIDPDLAAVVDAWPSLPATIKAGIVSMALGTGGRPE
jgi:hypothetical protein